jgi:hypothetical protein
MAGQEDVLVDPEPRENRETEETPSPTLRARIKTEMMGHG